MKKSVFTALIIILGVMIITPFNINAKELECVYKYENLEYKFYLKEDKLTLPFNDGDKFYGKETYFSDNFEGNFVLSSGTSNGGTICPSLVVEENELFRTIFLNSRDKAICNGNCQYLKSSTKQVKDTKIGNAVGIYGSKAYFIPVFRVMTDNMIEWSVDNVNFYDINDSIKVNNNDIVNIDKSLKNALLINEDVKIDIYRCVTEKNNIRTYKLSLDGKECNSDLSFNDGQGYGSTSYLGALGADDCKESALGDPNDENSVAWLLKRILSYIRILGPIIVIVMGSIDFGKAIVVGDDETMQKAYKKLIHRLLLVVALFFVPLIVDVLLDIFGITSGVCSLE